VKHLYLALDLFSLFGPFLLSFDKKVAFYKYWKALFPAIFIMMLLFIPWDIWKTVRGVWGFNPDYIEGVWLWELPLEEWLFFICIPYACVFIYECLIAYFPRDIFKTTYRAVLTLLAVFLIAIGLLNYHKWYAAITFPLTGFMLLSLLYYFKSPWLSRFLAAYLVSLIPFLLVNGVLTGSFLAEPVVWYNPDEIFNIRIFTIPVEDTIYNMCMLLSTIAWYEYFKCKMGISCTAKN
jgi:lycopene cyclase domain-containing protein